MIDREARGFAQKTTSSGFDDLLFALRELQPDCHLIKLGTMGEYGTPNIDIEEGYITIEHNGRRDTCRIPNNPAAFTISQKSMTVTT